MEWLSAVIVFCMVLFMYLHIHYQLKTSNHLEIYTIDEPSKNRLEEVCNLRQPVIFGWNWARGSMSLTTLAKEYGAFDLKIRHKLGTETIEPFVPLSLTDTIKLFAQGNGETFLTEGNQDFLEETGSRKILRQVDPFLRPPMVSKCIYDIWAGTAGSHTPLRYELNYRNFLCLASGTARVKLIPPRNGRYLDPIKDYDNFEYRSPVNPWKVQDRYQGEFDKVKTLEVDLLTKMVLYIPAYWWYSISYGPRATILVFQYRTYMNTMAILPQLCRHFLQRQSITTRIAEVIGVEEIEKGSETADQSGNALVAEKIDGRGVTESGP